jgi:hypothetical protein
MGAEMNKKETDELKKILKTHLQGHREAYLYPELGSKRPEEVRKASHKGWMFGYIHFATDAGIIDKPTFQRLIDWVQRWRKNQEECPLLLEEECHESE